MAGLDEFTRRLEMAESSGNPNAISMVNGQPVAYGVRQVTPSTGRWLAGLMGRNDLLGLDDAGFRKALLDPTINRQLSDFYINRLSDKYNGDQRLMAIGYNAGEGRADQFQKTGDWGALPAETRAYVPKLAGGNYQGMLSGGAGSDMLAGGGGSDAMAATGSGGASGSPFEGASDRQKWATWLAALGQSFRGQNNAQAMQQLSAMEGQGVDQNKTYQALVKRGIDPATAEWAVRDPQVMREVAQQLFAPKSKNMTISEIFDPATGRPVKVLVDQTTGEYQAIGGVSAPDPTKAPNLQAIDVFDEATGRKRKAVFNPTTGQMEPLGGIEAPDAGKAANMQVIEVYDDKTGGKRKMLFDPSTGQMTPAGGVEAPKPEAKRESALEKAIAGRKVEAAQATIDSAKAARSVEGIVAELRALAVGPDGKPNTQSGLDGAIGPIQGTAGYQNTLGWLNGNRAVQAKIANLTAKLNQELGNIYLRGLGSASESERAAVQKAIGDIPASANRDIYLGYLDQITTGLNKRIDEGRKARAAVPELDFVGDPVDEARAAIAAGAPRDAVIKRLQENGINPAGL